MSSVIAINTQQNLNYRGSRKYLGSVVYVSKEVLVLRIHAV